MAQEFHHVEMWTPFWVEVISTNLSECTECFSYFEQDDVHNSFHFFFLSLAIVGRTFWRKFSKQIHKLYLFAPHLNRFCFLQRIYRFQHLLTKWNYFTAVQIPLPLSLYFALYFVRKRVASDFFFLYKTFVLIVIHVWLWNILAQVYAEARTIPTISLSTALNIQFGKLTCGFYTIYKYFLFVLFEDLLHHRRHQHHYSCFIAGIYFTPMTSL